MRNFFNNQAHTGSVVLLCGIFLCILTLYTPESHAASEIRSNISLNNTLFQKASAGYGIFIKDEERFSQGQMVYAKQLYGIPVTMRKIFSFMPFFAHKHLNYSGPAAKKLSGLDINFRLKTADLFLKDRIRAEYHITDNFYRCRNAIEAGFSPVPPHLSLFSRYEFRFDLDQERLNQNDISGGLIIKPGTQLSVRLYYNMEMKRRNKNSWENTDAFCFSVAVVL